MSIDPDKVHVIVGIGGSVVVDARSFTPDKLHVIAGIAHQKGGTVTIRNASILPPDKAHVIAGAGKANVILDFT